MNSWNQDQVVEWAEDGTIPLVSACAMEDGIVTDSKLGMVSQKILKFF
jgi:hypothetical protein